MRTVKEVSNLSGVSIRTLHHYDAIGLLRPTQTTASGYRLYDDKALERLQMILLFRELKFSLREIGQIIDSPFFDKRRALEQQIVMLELQREHIDNLIRLAREINTIGVKNMMDFQAFDTKKMDEYARQAKESWGNTEAFKEFEKKDKSRSEEESFMLGKNMMGIFAELGAVKDRAPQDPEVQDLVKKLQDYITENFYTCTPEILASLGMMYTEDVRFQKSIDEAGGAGTAVFAGKAIAIYCGGVESGC